VQLRRRRRLVVAGRRRVRSPAHRQVIHHAADERLPNLRFALHLPRRRRGRPCHARRPRHAAGTKLVVSLLICVFEHHTAPHPVLPVYHYHNTINMLGEVCREFVSIPPKGGRTWSEKTRWYYDDSMKLVADAMRKFERKIVADYRDDQLIYSMYYIGHP
jgi:hypothetical protein